MCTATCEYILSLHCCSECMYVTKVTKLTHTLHFMDTVGCLFLRATIFTNEVIKGVHGNYFHKTTLVTHAIIPYNICELVLTTR